MTLLLAVLYTVKGEEKIQNLLGGGKGGPFRVPLKKFEGTYEGWNFNSGNYLFTTDTK